MKKYFFVLLYLLNGAVLGQGETDAKQIKHLPSVFNGREKKLDLQLLEKGGNHKITDYWEHTKFFARDSAEILLEGLLNREEKIFYAFGGLDGLGIGISLFKIFDLQYSAFITYQLVKAKMFLFSTNSAPYLGLNSGNQWSINLGGGGDSNKWFAILVGWQFYPFDTRGFYEIAIQHALFQENKNTFQPTVISFTAGIRLF